MPYRAIIVEQKCYESLTEALRGRGGAIKQRIVVPACNNLVITPFSHWLYAHEGFDMNDSSCRVIEEIEVPDELIETARLFVQEQIKFQALLPQFQEIANKE